MYALDFADYITILCLSKLQLGEHHTESMFWFFSRYLSFSQYLGKFCMTVQYIVGHFLSFFAESSGRKEQTN